MLSLKLFQLERFSLTKQNVYNKSIWFARLLQSWNFPAFVAKHYCCPNLHWTWSCAVKILGHLWESHFWFGEAKTRRILFISHRINKLMAERKQSIRLSKQKQCNCFYVGAIALTFQEFVTKWCDSIVWTIHFLCAVKLFIYFNEKPAQNAISKENLLLESIFEKFSNIIARNSYRWLKLFNVNNWREKNM